MPEPCCACVWRSVRLRSSIAQIRSSGKNIRCWAGPAIAHKIDRKREAQVGSRATRSHSCHPTTGRRCIDRGRKCLCCRVSCRPAHQRGLYRCRQRRLRVHPCGRSCAPVSFSAPSHDTPPRQLGTSGFHADVVDDLNPARHYIAFVFVGYWLPTPFARAALWIWEVASFIRYRGHWSAKDITSGNIGIRHGRLVRRFGPVVLPGLIAAEMASNTEDTQTLDNVLYVYSLGMA